MLRCSSWFMALALSGMLAGACRCSRGPRITTADELFSQRIVPRIELELGDKGLDRLKQRERKKDGTKKRKWAKARLVHADQVLRDVGVRLKGNRSARNAETKPPLKLAFDKFVAGQRLWGLAGLTLNNLAEDPTRVREALAYRLFREVGVPAPRTGFVEVVIDGSSRGLYVAIEAIDDDFLKAWFGADAALANVYEGEFGCDLFPDDVDRLEQDHGKDRSRADLRALAAVASTERSAHALFFAADAPLDAPRVLAYLAASAVLGDFDGYRHSHNYRIARAGASARWAFLPWGLDRTFKKRLSVADSGGLVARRCFADAECRVAYARAMQRVLSAWKRLDFPARARGLQALVDPIAAREEKPAFTDREVKKARRVLHAFLRSRRREAFAQVDCLDGDREIDRDGDGTGCLDCDDTMPSVRPGAPEVCGDKIDQDCSGEADDAPACGCPEETIAGARTAFCRRELAWDDAKAFCEAMGLHLARLDDESEAQAVAVAAQKQGRGRWWIGLSDRAAEGAFAWSDGATATFTRWAKGQPDDEPCNEDCVAIRSGEDGRWQDSHCDQRRPFVCR